MNIKAKTVKEVIAELQKFPENMEVWSFDYGDSKSFPIYSIKLQKEEEEEGEDYKVGYDVVMIC
jgi:hypothetical protein